MTSTSGEFDELTATIRDFAARRKWERFHTPKNLAMAVSGEAGELAAEFQWLTPEESSANSLTDAQLSAIEMEIADVQIYLLRLADTLGLRIPEAVRKKIAINEERF